MVKMAVGEQDMGELCAVLLQQLFNLLGRRRRVHNNAAAPLGNQHKAVCKIGRGAGEMINGHTCLLKSS